MSGQSWIRRGSPSSSKQGPMKATLPVSSLTRQNSNLHQQSQGNSPITLSPTSPWRNRTSPDQILSGIRSPGALNYKGKCHISGCHSRGSIRRTASLDTIYLTGQWPRDFHASLLHLDKATQTDEIEGKKSQRYTPDFSVMTEDKLDKMIRHRLLQRSATCKESIRPPMQEHSSQTSTPPPMLLAALPLAIPVKSRPPATMRSSTEGLNQEIERLVLRAMSSLGSEREEEKLMQITPEGHRAPLADLLRSTRSVNTQTPGGSRGGAGGGSHSSSGGTNSGASSRGSPSLAGFLTDASRPPSSGELRLAQFDSGESSPDQEHARCGTSPKINRFLAREPPDGCERVSLKFTEDVSSKDLSLIDYCDFKPNATFQLKPSLGSAFLPLTSHSQPDTTTTDS